MDKSAFEGQRATQDFPWGEGYISGRWEGAKEPPGSSPEYGMATSIPSRFALHPPALPLDMPLCLPPALMLREQRQQTGSSSEESGGQTQLPWWQGHRPSLGASHLGRKLILASLPGLPREF